MLKLLFKKNKTNKLKENIWNEPNVNVYQMNSVEIENYIEPNWMKIV